ncbi:MAG: ABC transporter permease [Phycisphaeraceae bacterium]|nr:ABC transporter permease [Phycisphaeraceae bacterium]
MYISLLIRKYLFRKIAPLFATLAVALCSAMVIIVLSVMGGFYDLMQTSARSLLGDVIITHGLSGFPHEKLLEKIETMDSVEAATPIVRTFGLLQLHGGISMVQVDGIDPESFNRVTRFEDAIHWRSEDVVGYANRWLRVAADEEQSGQHRWLIPGDDRYFQRLAEFFTEAELAEYGSALKVPQVWSQVAEDDDDADPAIVLGVALSPFNIRTPQGQYEFNLDTLGESVTLTIAPMTRSGELGDRRAVQRFTIVNEYKSGLMDADRGQVFVPFEILQKMNQFDAWKLYPDEDPVTLEPIGDPIAMPARATLIMVRAKPGIDAQTLRTQTEAVIEEHRKRMGWQMSPRVMTWRDQHAGLFAAVENERGLLTILFGIISMVAAVMIGVIFYMIAMEKTRDIGVLRAIGAGRAGIASIFLCYGLVLGIIGSILGVTLAWLVVSNINEIQEFLVVLGFQRVWDPQTYYFDRIPSRLDAGEVAIIVLAAITASIVAAIVPAILAAMVDPVKSLRYE